MQQIQFYMFKIIINLTRHDLLFTVNLKHVSQFLIYGSNQWQPFFFFDKQESYVLALFI